MEHGNNIEIFEDSLTQSIWKVLKQEGKNALDLKKNAAKVKIYLQQK